VPAASAAAIVTTSKSHLLKVIMVAPLVSHFIWHECYVVVVFQFSPLIVSLSVCVISAPCLKNRLLNLTCFTVSTGNPFILMSKGQRSMYHVWSHRNRAIHDEFWKPIYFGVKRSKVSVRSHRNTDGVGLCTFLSADFF